MSKVRPQVPEVDYPAILNEAWAQHLAPRTENTPTVISLFTGCGGSSLGYSMAGFRELLSVEWDNRAVETFRLNFPDVPVYHGDIAQLSVDECLRQSGLQPGELDILDGSPPCQGFSTAGKRNMGDDRNQLFREYVRLLRGLRPKVMVMENVSGLVKGKMKLIFAEIMQELKASGYRVKCQLMNAKYFSVPQSRQRLIFIGVRDDLGVEPTFPKAECRPIMIREAIPIPKAVLGYITASNERHTLNGRCPLRGVAQIAPTMVKSGNSRMMEGYKIERLSTFELSRFGGFPDNFMFIRSETQLVGNSVPPLFMRAIARHIRTEILQRLSDMGLTPHLDSL